MKKKHKLFNIQHGTIYRFTLEDKNRGEDLFLSQRFQYKKYRKRYGSPQRKYPIKDGIIIDDRPSVVEKKFKFRLFKK